MTIFDLLFFKREELKRLVAMGFKPEDCRFIDLYDEYRKMYARGEKVTYIVLYLAAKYHISERKVYKIIKKFGTDCTNCAV